ncbi:MAG: macrolide ABC transporter ATP-binding protein [Clostridiales bacterium]|nr:macrolide ABC transporter ATP-binding protein [Clostridiales bacterium]
MLLEMKDICKDYPQGKDTVRVLKDVCLQVEEGDYLAIMGPSGSGKTTLMNLIGCLDVQSAGTYLLDGEDLSNAGSNRLAQVRNRLLGFVFQSFYLLPKLNAIDNVALPLMYAGVPKKERRERAIEALITMGLEERMNFRPNQLSGGQCQRVAIARAIVGNPKLLLADEPTGALDTASGNQIMDIFDRLNAAGTTIIMITHERAIAERAKHIHYIRDGVLTTDEENEAPEDGEAGEDNA